MLHPPSVLSFFDFCSLLRNSLPLLGVALLGLSPALHSLLRRSCA
jgi:hypothetical protein